MGGSIQLEVQGDDASLASSSLSSQGNPIATGDVTNGNGSAPNGAAAANVNDNSHQQQQPSVPRMDATSTVGGRSTARPPMVPARTLHEQEKRKRAENIDFTSAIEHIVIVGNHNRHRNWRRSAWRERTMSGRSTPPRLQQQQQQQHELATQEDMPPLVVVDVNNNDATGKDDDPYNPYKTASATRGGTYKTTSSADPHNNKAAFSDETSETSSKTQHGGAACFLHAEDIRIYGLADNFAADAWPKEFRHGQQRKRFRISSDIDAPWNREHGDSIHPLDFMQTRLTRVDSSSSPEEEEACSGSASPFAASIETQNLLEVSRINQMDADCIRCTVDTKDVPRALLLRCWQRAMDAATCSTLQPQNTSPAMIAAATFNKGRLVDATRLQQLEKSAKQRCDDLAVDMFPNGVPPRNPPFKCRQCGNAFETRDQLRTHFHGNDNVRGCCWSLIDAKQRELIVATLQREVTSQADALVHLVFKEIRNRVENKADDSEDDDEDEAKPDQPRLQKMINWSDILNILNNSLGSSQDTDGDKAKSEREVTKTLSVHEGIAPLVLNRQVLESASQRLEDRYAIVPR